MQAKNLGIILGLMSGMLWGCMDVGAQYLLHEGGMAPPIFISVTMVITTVFMLTIALFKDGLKTFTCLGHWKNLRDLLIFGLLILGTETSFFCCVKVSDASTAAVLASTRPFWIMGIVAFIIHVRATIKQVLCGLLAVTGVAFLVTQGHFSELTLSWAPVLLGLGAAVLSACYTVQSKGAVKRLGAFLAAAWAMTVATIAANIYEPFWNVTLTWDVWTILALFVVGVVGHVCAYCCYLASAGKINPSVTGLMETVEPLTAVLLSYLIFRTHFDWAMLVGGALILTSVVILSFTKKP